METQIYQIFALSLQKIMGCHKTGSGAGAKLVFEANFPQFNFISYTPGPTR